MDEILDEILEEVAEGEDEDSTVGNLLEEDTGDTLEEEDSETVSCLVEDVPEEEVSGFWVVVDVVRVELGVVEVVEGA